MKLLGTINVDFDTTGQLLIMYSAFIEYLRQIRNTMKQCISCLDFKTAYNSVRRAVLYNIFPESDIPMKLLRLINLICILYN